MVDAVHAKGAKIFLQLFHGGRVSEWEGQRGTMATGAANRRASTLSGFRLKGDDGQRSTTTAPQESATVNGRSTEVEVDGPGRR